VTTASIPTASVLSLAALLGACNNESTAPRTPAAAAGFASVEGGVYHTCGRAPAGAAYCWGSNAWGQLGNGDMTNRASPAAVMGRLTFATMSVGGLHACGLTAGGDAYCWGSDQDGSLGAGAPGPEFCPLVSIAVPCSTLPLAVAGGVTFSSLSAGWGPTCALTAIGSAYCWGDNAWGALGIGSDTGSVEGCFHGPCSRTPLAVTGGHTLTELGVGSHHACGLTASGTAFCWGGNSYGQLGIGADYGPDSCSGWRGATEPCARMPVPVGGGLTFTRLSVGDAHTCGLATEGAWYCWGRNESGQLGNGTAGPDICHGSPCSTLPVAVASGVSFMTVFAGYRHSCGVTSAGFAHCWGNNLYGQLGDGTSVSSLTPVAVTGGLRFASVSPHTSHTCGLTTGGVAYCWGSNSYGQLGTGTSDSYVPLRVTGP
jgi:alpha-tubulin suppressor-like RCC1 family protein